LRIWIKTYQGKLKNSLIFVVRGVDDSLGVSAVSIRALHGHGTFSGLVHLTAKNDFARIKNNERRLALGRVDPFEIDLSKMTEVTSYVIHTATEIRHMLEKEARSRVWTEIAHFCTILIDQVDSDLRRKSII
jgi:hypothetical protein